MLLELNMKRDVLIVLGGVQYQDTYDGSLLQEEQSFIHYHLLQKHIFMDQHKHKKLSKQFNQIYIQIQIQQIKHEKKES